MSTVQDETDTGPAGNVSKPESSSLSSQKDEIEEQSEDRAELGPKIVNILQQVRQYEVERTADGLNGGLGVYGDLAPTADDESIGSGADRLVESVQEKPSSADGSSSIPDDTLSIQVQWNMNPWKAKLIGVEFDTIFTRRPPINFQPWIESSSAPRTF